MKKIGISVSVTANAVELLRNNLEIKEETKAAFLSTDYYLNVIRSSMLNQNVAEQYLDFFDCSDPIILFDKYIKVDENATDYDYTKASNANDRADCYFKIPCTFDIEKYIKALDKLNEDSADCTDSEEDTTDTDIEDSNRKVQVTDIIWDINKNDFENEADYQSIVEKLPTNVSIPASELDYNDEIADYLSNKYGYLVEAFCTEETQPGNF